jgi:hypothetical protein
MTPILQPALSRTVAGRQNKAPDLERRGFVANSPLFLMRGCRGAPLCYPNSSHGQWFRCRYSQPSPMPAVALVSSACPRIGATEDIRINCPLKDRRNQFECSILYRLLLSMGAHCLLIEPLSQGDPIKHPRRWTDRYRLSTQTERRLCKIAQLSRPHNQNVTEQSLSESLAKSTLP